MVVNFIDKGTTVGWYNKKCTALVPTVIMPLPALYCQWVSLYPGYPGITRWLV